MSHLCGFSPENRYRLLLLLVRRQQPEELGSPNLCACACVAPVRSGWSRVWRRWDTGMAVRPCAVACASRASSSAPCCTCRSDIGRDAQLQDEKHSLKLDISYGYVGRCAYECAWQGGTSTRAPSTWRTRTGHTGTPSRRARRPSRGRACASYALQEPANKMR